MNTRRALPFNAFAVSIYTCFCSSLKTIGPPFLTLYSIPAGLFLWTGLTEKIARQYSLIEVIAEFTKIETLRAELDVVLSEIQERLDQVSR